MKARNLGYWISTGLAAAGLAMGGVMQVSGAPPVVASLTHLGYPAYVATLLGAWKLLAAAALLAPVGARLSEWAYAGVFFLLTGAAYSHAMSGDPLGVVFTPLVLLGLAAASWSLRSQRRAGSRELHAAASPDAPATA